MYNVGAYISECLESVLKQETLPHEIICVDDASSDNGCAVVESVQQQNPDLIRLIRLEKNAGASNARNTALKIISGDYVQFLDADDLILPLKFSAQVKLAEANAFPDFIAGDYKRVDSEGKERIVNSYYNDPWMAIMRSRLGCTCSNLWKRESVIAAGGFDQSLKSSQEYNLMFRLLRANGRVIFDQTILTVVRERSSGSISTLHKGENWKRYVDLRREILHYLLSEKKRSAEQLQDFYQVFFDALRGLYPYDSKLALQLYEDIVPENFKPQVSEVSSASYIKVFRIFGFRFAEMIKSLTGKR